MKNMPDLRFHTRTRDFYKDPTVPMWIKTFHLFVMMDAKSTKKDGWTIWYQNPRIIQRFSIIDEETRDVIWAPSLSSVQKGIAELERMGFVTRNLNPSSKKRFIKLNRAKVIEFLRQNSFETDLYKGFAPKSRERKLIRRKIISVAEYINSRRDAQNEQFKAYLNFQARKYGYDINVPDVDIFDINVEEELFISRAELEFYLEARKKHEILDRFFENIKS